MIRCPCSLTHKRSFLYRFSKHLSPVLVGFLLLPFLHQYGTSSQSRKYSKFTQCTRISNIVFSGCNASTPVVSWQASLAPRTASRRPCFCHRPTLKDKTCNRMFALAMMHFEAEYLHHSCLLPRFHPRKPSPLPHPPRTLVARLP